MRDTFFKELSKHAEGNPDIFVLVGDVGFSAVEPFKDKWPDRFLNMGVCEQSMMGGAAGMAIMNKRVIVYSIIPFVTMRCYEQIRNDICYQNLPVIIAGVGSGFTYGAQGSTHHAIDDINIMRGLPGIRVFCPGDPLEVKWVLEEVLRSETPAYIRLGKNKEPVFHLENQQVDITRPIPLLASDKNIILSTGYTLELAHNVCMDLRNSGLDIGLFSVPCLKPFDAEIFLQNEFDSIFTLEEHNVIGGLGSAMAEIIAEKLSYKPVFARHGIPDEFIHRAGSSKYLRSFFGLDRETLVRKIQLAIDKGVTPKIA